MDRHEDAVTEDSKQIGFLKAEIGKLKDDMRQLIGAVEDLEVTKQQIAFASQAQQSALDRFKFHIADLKKKYEKYVREEGF